jgi:hypothetical protein
MTAGVCGFAWCGGETPGHLEHNWTDGVISTDCMSRRTRRVYTYVSIQEGFDEPLLIGVEDPTDDDGPSAEAWMSIEEAEYLRDALTTAIGHAKDAAVMSTGSAR